MTTAGLPVCKACELADFAHPELRDELRAIFAHEIDRFGRSFPIGSEYRKHWEVGMTLRALRQSGVLTAEAEVLGVGAGAEPTIFVLSNLVRRVFATDLYVHPDGWEDQAPIEMMLDPGAFWPGPWNPRRVVVQHMNAMELRYEDATFDAVFSSSSLEHFGSLNDIELALAEMRRVVRPGGVLSISTELHVAGSRSELDHLHLFTAEEVAEILLDKLEPLSGLDFQVSAETLANPVTFVEACRDLDAHVAVEGALRLHKLRWNRYPHIALTNGDQVWTSVHVAGRVPHHESA